MNKLISLDKRWNDRKHMAPVAWSSIRLRLLRCIDNQGSHRSSCTLKLQAQLVLQCCEDHCVCPKSIRGTPVNQMAPIECNVQICIETAFETGLLDDGSLQEFRQGFYNV